MKILMLDDSIISMENVRSAKANRSEETHTHKGSKVTTYRATITIAYQTNCEDEHIYITANTEQKRESEIRSILNKIAQIVRID